MVVLCLLLAVPFLAIPAKAERLVSQVSNDTVEITSSFDGERLTFFGTIEPDIGATDRVATGPFHVVIVVSGPTQHRVVREKTNNWGFWLNTDKVEFANVPGYFQVLSSGRLAELAHSATLADNAITPEAQLHAIGTTSRSKSRTFGAQLLHQMAQNGLYGVHETGVTFSSDNFYSARLHLPSTAPPGPYIALTYVFRNGAVIARSTSGFAVRKIGLERFLALSSVQSPLLYGFSCVALALVTGWLGGAVFKR